MASLATLPPLPPQFKSIQHHLRTAQEHDKRDPVVAYYCRLYAMQTGMKIDSKTPECRKFLSRLMDQLEALKKQLGDNEAITQEIVGSAHLENYALKMFLYADNEDRAGRFHKNMIKSFYTASLLIDVITVFGELTDENVKHRKYARWKATYIHNCLKNGETPQAGPVGIEEDNDVEENEDAGATSLPTQPLQPSSSTYDPSTMPSSGYTGIQIPPGAHAPANTPAEVPHSTGVTSNTIQPTPQTIPAIDPALFSTVSQGDIRLTPEDFARAQKYCKYAGSALQYEDVGTAVQNLQKALKLLTTGRE
ncbi:vacuolar protein sorting-associated protein VTA1 homolog isoform 3-T3 [Dama dama]|uniref:vacuolar protein sorting-associated protein VTA1 homolog isoform X3 n=1 Tax=Cervus canadensis TaxID=1574408 RepID=UPI001CA32290|nr:vacuolar protein sorting-associated protein VTA1 homolog isoform X3 [Cervus canadensis]XP_043744153.1 vacuolar protein sorting-associated protein VTA1 homolog isoform X3 [Cervus elaphus]XP_060986438.1 vacuolar protein sorting-associated protein VTA1 homolog isoform X3 [Dama dama]